tara:strand:- start:281 stop:499 length:219 start_codon:yes stop_codon:yes gene_type:complete
MQKLIDELENKIKPIENNDDVYFNYGIRKSIQIALELLEIEKEQIINACNSAFEDKTTWGERYYNQTYNNGI